MRIFLSYGHDDYASIAFRIKRDLEALSHEVWFDVERLKPGGDWEQYIAEGFEFVSKDVESGRFLLLLTPHSVRRPNGYCLNELARAYGRNLPVIPVMVSTVEAPLSICRLQCLDMRQCFPVDQHEEQYARQFAQLVNALTEKQVPFEGVQQRLLNYLQPITYSDDLNRHLSRFTGREWVMDDVNAWLASSNRVLWITGEAGVGKSAVSAWLCTKRPEIVAYHFCRFGNSDRVDARKALFSLAYQLSTQLPVYQDRLNASPLDQTTVEPNVAAVFDRLFVIPLTDVVPLTGKSYVLLIDALDEATSKGGNELASLIGNEFDRLPSWLRLIVTSRPYEQEINSELQSLDPWKLNAGREENFKDVRTYLYRELRPFTGDRAPSGEVLNKIIEKSEGLFLYVSLVREELEKRRLSLARLEEFPQGLGGVYQQWFKRYFPDPKLYESECRPALEAICAAREPLPRDYLSAMMNWTDYQLDTLAAQLGSLFPFVDERVHPVHQSVRDWLTDRERSGVYRVDINAGEQRLADFALQQYQSGVGAMSIYSVLHAPSHFAARRKSKELQQLLLDPDWMQAKLQAADIVPLLADYDVAVEILSPKPRTAEAAKPVGVPIGIPPWTMVQAAHVEAESNTTDDRGASTVQLIEGAVRLSSNVISSDLGQFTSQMVARLLVYKNIPAVSEFTKRVAGGTRTPWFRALVPALEPPGTVLFRTLAGHSSLVSGVAVTPDGQRMVSTSYDNTLKVWELESGRELRTLTGHEGGVKAVAVTPDGQRAVSASADLTLRVWEIESGRAVRTLTGHSSFVNGVAVTPDGLRAVSASEDGTLKVWKLDSGLELFALTGHTSSVNGVAVTPDGLRAVSASEDGTLKVWKLDSGLELFALTGHTSSVNGVAVTPDGLRAVSASEDGTLKVWELASGLELRTLSGHSASVTAVAVTPNGQGAVSGSEDGTLKLWDHLGSEQEVRTLAGHADSVGGVAVTPDGQWGISASDDYTLKVWYLAGSRAQYTLTGHNSGVTAVGVTQDGRRAVSASFDQTLKVWDLESGRAHRTLIGHKSGVGAVAVMQDGQRAVSASYDHTLKVWDLTSGRELRTLTGHDSEVTAVAVTPDGRWAISASDDRTLKVWDLTSGDELCTLSGHSDYVRAVAVTPDGQRAISASDDYTLRVWDLASGDELRTLSGHSGYVRAVAVTPDGQRVISASRDWTLKVWDLANGRELRTLTGHSVPVRAVAVTSNGQRVISASEDNTVKLWNLETGEVLATFTCEASASCCAVSEALNLVVAGDDGGHLHFLRLEEPKAKR